MKRALVAVAVCLAAAAAALTPTASANAAGLTFGASADTWVNSNQPTAVAGNALRLVANGSPVKYGLLKFDVSGIPTGATGVTGVLTLSSPVSQTAATVQIKTLANSWTESSNYSSAPRPGTLIASGTMPSSGSVSFTVPVTGNGQVSYAYTKTGAGDTAAASSENTAALAPKLVVSYGTTTPTNTAPTVNAGADQSVTLRTSANLDGTVTDDGLPSGSTVTHTWSKVSGPGTVTFGNASAAATTASFSVAGTYLLRLTATDGSLSSSDDVQVTVGSTPPPPPPAGDLPYSADSFFKSRVDGAGVPVSSTLTTEMRHFMSTFAEQAAVTWPKVNLNPGWSGHNYVHRSGDTAPVWKLASNTGGTSDSRLGIVRTQGVHIKDSAWDTVPSGDQDRLLVLQDHVFGYTVQCADVVPNKAARTWTASNCGIMWHSSNGLDHRNPQSDDERNYSSRGRLLDAMQIPRAELDRAVANGTGVGHVMHLFWVATEVSDGFSSPMVGNESNTPGWGGEGWRMRIAPSVNLVNRGLTGACLAIARTLQENGGYIGDNSGSSTQLKVGPPEDYVGTNLATDCMKGKVSWNDFEVVQPGWQ
jgi:hypothetical protein